MLIRILPSTLLEIFSQFMPKTRVIWKSISDADASDYFDDILMINASSRKYMKEKCLSGNYPQLSLKYFSNLYLKPELFGKVSWIQMTSGFNRLNMYARGSARKEAHPHKIANSRWQRNGSTFLEYSKQTLSMIQQVCVKMKINWHHLTFMLLVANFANTKWCKNAEDDWNPGIWVLI